MKFQNFCAPMVWVPISLTLQRPPERVRYQDEIFFWPNLGTCKKNYYTPMAPCLLSWIFNLVLKKKLTGPTSTPPGNVFNSKTHFEKYTLVSGVTLAQGVPSLKTLLTQKIFTELHLIDFQPKPPYENTNFRRDGAPLSGRPPATRGQRTPKLRH